MQKTAFFAKNPSPQHFCVGKFFRDRTMRKLSSRGFRKCGTFGSCELFNGSYCCSKSTDFEILGLSPKIRRCKKSYKYQVCLKCGTFWAWKPFNGRYCCSKSTDFEILCPSPKINPSKMEVAPQGCLHVISQKTNDQIN